MMIDNDRTIEEQHRAFLATPVDTTEFSPRFQRIIANYEQEVAKRRAENETALEYLRRVYPQIPESARLRYMWLCGIAGISVRSLEINGRLAKNV